MQFSRRQFWHTQAQPPHPPGTIGADVWVGAGAIILPGVTVGSRIVIGAGNGISKSAG
jgi:acetyltransferase-like isoleucine patch superfamily enzyme